MDLSETAWADALEAEIQRVEAMSLPDLRTLWTARWGRRRGFDRWACCAG